MGRLAPLLAGRLDTASSFVLLPRQPGICEFQHATLGLALLLVGIQPAAHLSNLSHDIHGRVQHFPAGDLLLGDRERHAGLVRWKLHHHCPDDGGHGSRRLRAILLRRRRNLCICLCMGLQFGHRNGHRILWWFSALLFRFCLVGSGACSLRLGVADDGSGHHHFQPDMQQHQLSVQTVTVEEVQNGLRNGHPIGQRLLADPRQPLILVGQRLAGAPIVEQQQ